MNPTVPGDLNFAVYSSQAAELFWTASTDDGLVTGYDIYRDGVLIEQQLDENSFIDETLAPSSTYHYRLFAVDNDGNRSSAAEITLTTDDDESSPIQHTDSSIAQRYPGIVDSSQRVAQPVSDTILPEHSRYIGDVNGDGIKDISQVLIDGQNLRSSAVYFGTATGELPDIESLNGSNGFIIDNVWGDISDENDYWRGGISDIGDVNGDGFADISFQNIGDYPYSGWGFKVLPGAQQFSARRSAPAIASSELLIELGTDTGQSKAGDFNGDGFDDVLLGLGWSRANIIYGQADINFVSTLTELPGEQLCQGCGLRSVGDFDADGYDDLVMSSRAGECGYSRPLNIVYGSLEGIVELPSNMDYEQTAHTRIVSEAGAGCSTGSVTSHGDFNGDSASDILVSQYLRGEHNFAGLIYGTLGERPRAVSYDELDGAKGFQLSLGPNLYIDGASPVSAYDLSIEDADADGFDDILFPDATMYKGFARNVSSIDGPVVYRTDTTFTVHWRSPNDSNVKNFRILVNDAVVTEVDAGINEVTFADPVAGVSAELILQTIAADGTVIENRLRRVPAYTLRENLTGEVQGDRLLELTFNGDHDIRYYSHYLVWRDGEPIGRSINGADNYVDAMIQPGTTYQYFITPDYLMNDTLDPSMLQSWPLLQRQSNTIELTTFGPKPPAADDSGTPPTEPGDSLTVAPTNIRLLIYASTIAELFWDNANGVVNTQVYRDDELIGVSEGTSYYDPMRQPGVPHRYELVATTGNGTRSPSTRLGNFENQKIEFDGFAGWSDEDTVVISGDIAVVTIHSRDKNVGRLHHVVERSPSGQWAIKQTLTSKQDFYHDSALALDDDTLLVGLVGNNYDFELNLNDADPIVSINEYKFDLFERDTFGQWNETSSLDFSDALTSNLYFDDISVALEGDTAMLGGRNGAVYVFVRDAGGQWIETQKLESTNGTAMGESIAIDGDTAVISSALEGGAYVYSRDENGTWVQIQKLNPDKGNAGESFSTAIEADTIVIGGYKNRIDGNYYTQHALYSRDTEGRWRELQTITVNDSETSLALDAGTLLIGAPNDNGLAIRSGSVHVYRQNTTTQWKETNVLFAHEIVDSFGNSVALNGGRVMVSANIRDSIVNAATYIFTLSSD